MKRVLFLLVACIFIFAAIIPFCAYATESNIPNWDTVDWKTFDWKQVNSNESENSLYIWLRDEASLSKLFQANSNCTHAAMGESFWDLIYNRFVENPAKFLKTLAKEDAQAQQQAIACVAIASEYQDKQTTISTVEGIRLSKEQNPEAVALMLELIEKIEEMSGIVIEPPKTGDSVLSAVAALVLSGFGLVLLSRKALPFGEGAERQ